MDGSGVSERYARVAPHAGAWIEIMVWIAEPLKVSVAPHAGAWIEIFTDPGMKTG